MNYKLAKQLKDNGFPQEVSWGDFFYDDELGGKILYTVKKDNSEAIDGLTRIPSISELIKECTEIDKRYSFSLEYWAKEKIWATKFKDEYGYGETPEISVAKLLIKLLIKLKSNK